MRSRTEHEPRTNRVPALKGFAWWLRERSGGWPIECATASSSLQLAAAFGAIGPSVLDCDRDRECRSRHVDGRDPQSRGTGPRAPYQPMRQRPHSRRGPSVFSSHSTRHRDREKRCDHSLMAHHPDRAPREREYGVWGAWHCEPMRLGPRPGIAVRRDLATPAVSRVHLLCSRPARMT